MIRIYEYGSQWAKIGAYKRHNHANQKIVVNSSDFGEAGRNQHLSQLNEEPKHVEI